MALTLRDGVWYIDLRADGGKRHSTRLPEKMRREAQDLHDVERSQLIRGQLAPKAKTLSLQDALNKLERDPSTTEKSQHGLNATRAQLLEYFGIATRLDEITSEQLDEFVSWGRKDKKWADSTINRKFAVLSKLFRFGAGKWEVLQRVPEIPWLEEPEGRIRWFDPTEEQQIISYFAETKRPTFPGFHNPVMALLVPVLIDTGMRLGEALSLTDDAVDINRSLVRVWLNKANKPRTIPLTTRSRQIIGGLMGHGKPFHMLNHDAADKAWAVMREALGKAGDPLFVLHACRHTCATRLIEETGDLQLVQEWLGHRDIRSTQVYAHITPKALRRGAEALERASQVEVTKLKLVR